METEIIRSEIDKTMLRINYRLQLIEQRTRDAARFALIWSVATVTAVGVIAGVAVWRYRRRESSRRDRRARSRGLRPEAVTFSRVGPARFSAQPRSTP